MTHAHQHSHAQINGKASKALLVGIFLNAAYVVAEAIFGFVFDSLSLLSDAGHNLTDVLGLLLSLLAFRLMKIRKTGNMSYGYRKASILISLLNSLILVATVAGIFAEAFHRFFHPVPVPGLEISIVAIIGVGVNYISARFFREHRDTDINLRGAYLHLIADALVSVAVFVSGILIYYTGIQWLDPLLGVIVGCVILRSAWGIFRESIRLSLDGVPENVDMDEVASFLNGLPEVQSVSHLHVWALSSAENALTVHLHFSPGKFEDFQRRKKEIRKQLETLHIHHATFEAEIEHGSSLRSDI